MNSDSVHHCAEKVLAPMFVTRHSNIVDAVLREKLWHLYRCSYTQTAEATVTHEMLERQEFDEQISQDSSRIWVVWSESLPVAMTLVSTDVRATRWLSDLYFAKHFPDRFRQGQVHYIVWVVVDPATDLHGANMMLARQALSAEAQDGALLVFDVPDLHQPGANGGAAELLYRMAKMVGDVELLPLSTQRYFALDFAKTEIIDLSQNNERSVLR